VADFCKKFATSAGLVKQPTGLLNKSNHSSRQQGPSGLYCKVGLYGIACEFRPMPERGVGLSCGSAVPGSRAIDKYLFWILLLF
jgi:hypothetical protein